MSKTTMERIDAMEDKLAWIRERIDAAEKRLNAIDESVQEDRDNVPEWLWMEQN